ncbi:MAG: hypothetical protein ABSB40_09470 [Nitrososphaeria archaeon]
MCSLYNYSENFNRCLLEIIRLTQQKMFDIKEVISKIGNFEKLPKFSKELSAILMTLVIPSRIVELEERKSEIERQMFTFLRPLSSMDYFSRLKLRLLLGLPANFEEDSGTIISLDGLISGVTSVKMDVVEIIRRIRDNE